MTPYSPEPARGWAPATIFDGSLTSWRVARTLRKMSRDAQAPGHSDRGVQNLVFSLVISLRPRRVLEIGTHIGTGSVIIGHGLKCNGYGRLLTLEPHGHYRNLAQKYVTSAGVHQYVQIVPMFSYQDECKRILRDEAPFELIFIDGAHDYEAASHDIALSADLLCTNGVMVLHDVGVASPSYDLTGRGGVRQALWDFCSRNRDFRPIFFEFPLWLNDTGTAMVCKQQLDPLPSDPTEDAARPIAAVK